MRATTSKFYQLEIAQLGGAATRARNSTMWKALFLTLAARAASVRKRAFHIVELRALVAAPPSCAISSW